MSRRERTAKLFKHGGSQAVRLPKEYRFEGAREVRISRDGKRVILEPLERNFSKRFLELAGSAEDFPYPEEIAMADDAPDLD